VSPRPRAQLPDEAFERNGHARVDATAPRNRTAGTIRELIDLVVSRDVDDEILATAAGDLEAVLDRLNAAAAPGKRVRGHPDPSNHPQDYFPNSPLAGATNPLSLPLDMWGVSNPGGLDFIRGRAVFSLAYEGPPTCVHGGMIALLFDEILGNANIVAGRPGMTGTLTIRYRRPTPLLVPLELEARQIRVEGRKIMTTGTITVAGEITAEAEAIFIEVPPSQMLGIAGHNAQRAGGDVVDPELRRAIEAD